MFKKHSINIKFVKDAEETPAADAPTTNPFINEETAAIAKDIIKHATVAVASVAGGIIVLKTLGQMAVITTEAAVAKNTK